ncbi:MAG: dihydrolipoyl dehydrogenase [Alphaproteobacteria bacterium]|nr:dihydrolipoyl dehydrogenase [Alphaproteobacteria bacterium]
MTESYDLVVIGAGPGGYVAAIRAAQLGMKVACVEKRATLGGTCLNVGCIPSKAMLSASGKYAETAGHLADIGIEVGSVKLNLKKMLANKDKVVEDLTTGIGFLFKKNKVDWVSGAARVKSANEVFVMPSDGEAITLKTERVLIATGSESAPLPGVDIDEKRIVTSTGALSLSKVPKHLVVVGGGYIGLEMGSVWARLGAQVTVVEFLDRIVPTMDREIGKRFMAVLRKQGMTFKLSTKVTSAKASAAGVKLSVEAVRSGEGETIDADVVLVSIGRRPHTDGLGLEALGVATDQRGFIQVDADFETNVPGVFAIGDSVPGPMLAHKAEEDGVAAVEIMAGQSGHVDYSLVPGIVYTHPEVASIGKTEEDLKEAGTAYRKGSFPFTANSRARTTGEMDGTVKILADAETDRVLGVHIMGPEAGNLIHECATAMAFGATAEDIARTCHGHPTYNEAVKEAALAVDGRPIHI